MKKLIALTFAASCLLRPSLVLCVETSGDVRVEYQETQCCADGSAASDLGLHERGADECDGCIDFSLTTHSLLKRTAASTPPTFVFALDVAPAATTVTASIAGDAMLTIHSRVLATTVIRR
jgi:hypothetical protein